MASRLTTREWRLHSARQFIESIEEAANSSYYMWAGGHVEVSPTPNVEDDVLRIVVQPYRDMCFGKRVTASDVSLVVRRIDYTSNTVYAQYDDGDPELLTKDYYVVVNAGSFSHVFKCLEKGSLISTPTGMRKIEDLQPGDEVYDASGITKITETHSRSVDETITLKYRGIEITSSVDHIHLVANSALSERKEVLAANVKAGDWILIPNNVEKDQIEWNLGKPSAPQCKWWPETIALDTEWARLIGLYLAEGCSCHYGRDRRIIWSFGEHEEHYADEVYSILKKKGLHSLKYLAECKSATYGPSRCWTVVCCSSGLVRFFEELGLGTNSHDKNISTKFPSELVLSLIGGWLDVDGCQQKTNIKGWSKSKNLIKGFWRLLLKNDVCANIIESGHGLQISRREDVEKILQHTTRFVEPLYKTDKYKDSPTLRKTSEGWMCQISSVTSAINSAEVISIETESHRYIAENVETHNCLDNNLSNTSTVTPEFGDIDVHDEVYQTSDGYRWKYMYSVTDAQVTRFATSQWFPLIANSEVANAATDGSIDVVRIQEVGEGYDNYLTGTFSAGDIRVNGNTLTYALTGNSTASSVNGFYTGCNLYISAGTGAGQYATITDYYSNANGKYAVIDVEFDTTPTNASEYEVYPTVSITGSSRQTINAYARALVNSVGNSIYRVEMLSRGLHYDYAVANVIANTVVGVITVANVQPAYSPPGGHGYDAASELGAAAVSVSVRFSNSESNTIPVVNGFRQIGLMRDPLFQDVRVAFSSANGIFTNEESARTFTKKYLANGAVTNSAIANVTLSGGVLDTQLSANDWVYLKSSAGTDHQLIQVNSVTNSSHFVLTANALFSCSSVSIYLANVGPLMYVSNVITANVVEFSNVVTEIAANNEIVGLSSGAWGTVNSISRSGVTKGFSTFVQMHKYIGSYDSGTFTQDEKVYQGTSLANSTANASLHSAVSNAGSIEVYVSNQVGIFTTTDPLKGNTSGASFTIATAYGPEIAFGSGKHLYIENMSMVERTASNTEQIALVFRFSNT